jgi:hypothetical protein
VPRSTGGITCLCNGQLLCAYHNRTVKNATDRTNRRPSTNDVHPCPHPEHHTTADTAANDPDRAPPQTG